MGVCAYANNQHELGADITEDPRASSFFKAMQLCDGVLVVLDPHGMPYTRCWCCFELSMCMLEKDENGTRRLKLDLAVGHREPRVIAEGLDSSTNFPVPLLALGFKIDIAQSKA